MDYLVSAMEYVLDLKHRYWDGIEKPELNEQLDTHLNNSLCKFVYTRAGSSFSCLVERDKLQDSEFMQDFSDYITTSNVTTMNQDALIDATLITKNDDALDLTSRFNKYLGDSGSHIELFEAKPKLRWLLTPDEIANFKQFHIMNSSTQNYSYDNLDERIGNEIFYIEEE